MLRLRRILDDYLERPADELLAKRLPRQADRAIPRVRRRAQRRARPDPDLRQLPQRIEAHFRPINDFVGSSADYLDWDAFAHAFARHVQHPTAPTATDASRA